MRVDRGKIASESIEISPEGSQRGGLGGARGSCGGRGRGYVPGPGGGAPYAYLGGPYLGSGGRGGRGTDAYGGGGAP
jgi:hypothetical protein